MNETYNYNFTINDNINNYIDDYISNYFSENPVAISYNWGLTTTGTIGSGINIHEDRIRALEEENRRLKSMIINAEY